MSYGDERLKDRDVEEWAKIVWINLLESAEVAFVTCQSNVPDLWQVNGWRRGLLETLLRLSCEWEVFREKWLQIKSLRKWVRFTLFESQVILLARRALDILLRSCIEVWVGHNVIKTDVWQNWACARYFLWHVNSAQSSHCYGIWWDDSDPSSLVQLLGLGSGDSDA
jgi:hypothetical protein